MNGVFFIIGIFLLFLAIDRGIDTETEQYKKREKQRKNKGRF